MWETYIQKSNFASEIHAIKSNKRNNLKHQPELESDENGLLRCHGRLVSENLPQNTVYSKLLPKNNAFPNLVIISFHEKLMHAGVSHTLSAIRSEYWSPQGRAAVKEQFSAAEDVVDSKEVHIKCPAWHHIHPKG